jgi:hypothetical protein
MSKKFAMLSNKKFPDTGNKTVTGVLNEKGFNVPCCVSWSDGTN